MRFGAPYDTTCKAISAAVAVSMAFLAILLQSLFVAGLAAALLVLCYLWSPRGYTVDGGLLTVHRAIGAARIPLAGASELRPATWDDYRGTIRLFGNGGLFGYYGLFRTEKLGKCTWYVTDRSRAVVIVTPAKTVLVSPADPDSFISAVQSQTPVPPGPGAAGLPAAAPRFGLAGALVGMGIAALAIGVVAFALSYSPGPPAYTLTAQSLAIHDRFYPFTLQAADVDAARIRVVDLDTNHEWQPTLRTNGFANSHYRAGRFRVAGGQTVRLYRADGRRLVLLPPRGSGMPVLLQTTDPDGFAAQVRREWGGGLP